MFQAAAGFWGFSPGGNSKRTKRKEEDIKRAAAKSKKTKQNNAENARRVSFLTESNNRLEYENNHLREQVTLLTAVTKNQAACIEENIDLTHRIRQTLRSSEIRVYRVKQIPPEEDASMQMKQFPYGARFMANPLKFKNVPHLLQALENFFGVPRLCYMDKRLKKMSLKDFAAQTIVKNEIVIEVEAIPATSEPVSTYNKQLHELSLMTTEGKIGQSPGQAPIPSPTKRLNAARQSPSERCKSLPMAKYLNDP